MFPVSGYPAKQSKAMQPRARSERPEEHEEYKRSSCPSPRDKKRSRPAAVAEETCIDRSGAVARAAESQGPR